MRGYGSLWLVQKHPQCLRTDLTSPAPPSPPPHHEYIMGNEQFLLPNNEPPLRHHHVIPRIKNSMMITYKQDEKEEHEELRRSRFEWDFTLSTVISTTPTAASTSSSPVSNTLGVIEFDPSETVVATGGIARKIRIYSVESLMPNNQNDVVWLDHASACDYYICTPAKLSSLRWRPGSGGRVLGSADYDGVVTEYDLHTQQPVFERDEHGGRRIWSLDYSAADPYLAASGSDDGTLQMWDPRCCCVAKVVPSSSEARNPVCCVEFDPLGGPLLAVGCANRKAYVYDARNMAAGPVVTFDGHGKTVTYVRFLDGGTMVSAGTDGCLKMWGIDDAREIRTYRGHVNNRSFVGLSIWRRGGLLGCGSENNRVFVYDKRWGEPIWVHGFEQPSDGFVSSVCWRQMSGGDHCALVAGGSDGVLQVFVGRRKSLSSD